MCYHPQLSAWKNPPKTRPNNSAQVLPVRRAQPPRADGILLGGQIIETPQSHLLEPFAALLASVDEMAAVAAAKGSSPFSAEENCVRAAYASLRDFFRALLPSASAESLEPLTYSVALLLVGEAIEAARIVVAAGESLHGALSHPEIEEKAGSSHFSGLVSKPH